MEEIEYLEEYEDLVLPALNSAAAAAATSSALQNKKINDGDDSSSSLDQDIFNCLFDDNSDDEDFSEHQKGAYESELRPKTGYHESFDALDNNIEELAEKVIQKVEISRQDQTSNFSNIGNTENKITLSTPKYKTLMTKTSGTTVPLNTIRQEKQFTSKSKSIATVRPTVQNQKQQQTQQLKKKSNLLPRSVTSTSSFVQRQNPSTSSSSFSKNPAPSSTIQKLATQLTRTTKRPATIVRPEKIITKNPANDPLDLEEFSEAGSDNSSFSDISGETYNSFSDLVEDDSNDEFYSGGDDFYDDEDDEGGVSSNSQVIEISNDSGGAPSNLEDLRATTPSPVISDDSDTPSSSFGFTINKSKSINPYSHPDIIDSVLRKGKKPLLLELLRTNNLLEGSVEDNVGDNIVIDITKSSENLLESLDTQQIEKKFKDTLLPLQSPIPKTEIDPVDLTQTENDKSITADLINKNPTTHSKKTNKNKSKKKSITNMDYRDFKSSGSISVDSDLSEVEELLEESYAEAMKRVKGEPFSGQELGAEIEIGGEEEVTVTEQNKQKLLKAGAVIDYDDIQIEEPAEANKNEKTEINTKEQSDTCQKETAAQDVDKKNAKSLFENIEIKEADRQSEPKDCLQHEEIVKENFACENENITNKDVKQSNMESQEAIKTIKLSDNVKACDSPNARKKKRFRNLITPEPTEDSLEAAKSIDDIKDFKGFEEVQAEDIEKIEVMQENPQYAKEIKEKIQTVVHTEVKNRLPESFKSPSSIHQSLKDKSKEFRDKKFRDNSKERKDKSFNPSKSTSFRDRSKDSGSTESSRESSSRESSKDRSRESSKDHSFNKVLTPKSYHNDHRKSTDSQESSRSRESSKSRDLKDTKTESKDSNKSTTVKNQKPPDSNKERSTEKRDIKSSKPNEKRENVIDKTSKETKYRKDRDNKKDLKEHKSSSEKEDKKPDETHKPKEKDSCKPLPPKEHKQKELIDVRKTPSSSRQSESSNSSRDSSKERKNINKQLESPKSFRETKNSENEKTPSIPAVNVKNSSTSDEPKENTKSSQDNKNPEKIVKKSLDPISTNKSFKSITKSATDSNLILKNAAIKKANQSPPSSKITNSSSTDSNISKSFSKSIEAGKKDPEKIVKVFSSDSKKEFKTENQNKSINAKSQLNKLPDPSNKTKTQTPIKNMPKKSIATNSSIKRPEGSNTKPSSLETKETNAVKSTSESDQKIKTVQSVEMKSNEKFSDSIKPIETSKNITGPQQQKPAESLRKDTEKTSTELIIKKAVETNVNHSVKAKNQEDAKSLDIATPQKSEKTKSPVIKIKEKADELKKTKADSNKRYDSKQTVDLITGSEKSQNNSEKKQIVKSRININKIKTETPQAEDKNLTEIQYGADTQKAKVLKVNKDELEEPNSKTKKEESDDKETKNKEKNKIQLTSEAEQKEKKQEEPEACENSTTNLTTNIKIQTITNEEQKVNKQERVAPRRTEKPNDQLTTIGKIQTTTNNEQIEKKQEKTKPKTCENVSDSVTVKENTQSTTNKKQTEKPQEKAEPRKSENPNDTSTTKGRIQTTIDNKQNVKNLKKTEPSTQENSDSLTIKRIEFLSTSNAEQENEAESTKIDPNDHSTSKGKAHTTSGEQKEKKQENADLNKNEVYPTTKEITQPATNNKERKKKQENVASEKGEKPSEGKIQAATNNKQQDKKQEKAEPRKSENPNILLTPKRKTKTITQNEQKEKKQAELRSENPGDPLTTKSKNLKSKNEQTEEEKSSNVSSLTTKGKAQATAENQEKEKKQEKAELKKSEDHVRLSTPKGEFQTTENEQKQKKQESAELRKNENPSDSSMIKDKTQTYTKNEQQEISREKSDLKAIENPNDSLTSKGKTQTTTKSEEKEKKQEKAELKRSENSVLSTPKEKSQTIEISEQKQKTQEKSDPRKIENPNKSSTIKSKTQITAKTEANKKQEKVEPRKSGNPNNSSATKKKVQMKNKQKEKISEETESRKIENPKDLSTTKEKESDISEKTLVSITKPVSSPKTSKKLQKQAVTTSEDEINPVKLLNTVKQSLIAEDASQEMKKNYGSNMQKEKLDLKQEMEAEVKSKIPPSLETAKLQSDIKEKKKHTVIGKVKDKLTETRIRKVNTVVDETTCNSSAQINIEQLSQITSKSGAKAVLQEKADSDISAERRKTKNLIDSKLQKSAVLVIEPVTVEKYRDKNVNVNAINSIVTRSRNDDTKLNDSVIKEESVKGKMSKNTEALSATRKKDKSENEKQNTQLIKIGKKSDVETKAEKSEGNKTKGSDEEIIDISQINVSQKDLKPSKDKIETIDNSEKEIGLVLSDIEKDQGTLSSDDMTKVESSTQSEIEEHFKSERGSVRRELEVKTEEKIEKANVILSEEDLYKKEAEDILRIGASLEQQIAEMHQEQSGGEMISTKTKNAECHEKLRTRSHGNIKGEDENNKLAISNADESWNEKTVPKLEQTKSIIETLKTKGSEKFNKEVEKDEITSMSKEAKRKSIKTKSNDLKEEVGKDEMKILNIESSQEQSFEIQSSLEDGTGNKNIESEYIDPFAVKSVKKEAGEYNLSLKTRSRGNFKEVEKRAKDISQIKPSDIENSALRESEEIGKSNELNEEKKENQTSGIETILSQKDGKKHVMEVGEKEQMEILQHKISGGKTAVPKKADEDFERKKTRSRADVKESTENEKSEIHDIKSSNEKPPPRKEFVAKFDPIKTRRRGEHKEDAGKEKIEKLQKDSSEEHIEPRKTRNRSELNEELGKEKTKNPKIQSSEPEGYAEHFEPKNTRNRGDEKPATQTDVKEKLEPIKTGRRSAHIAEMEKEKRDVSQAELSGERTTTEKDLEEPTEIRTPAVHEEEARKGKQDALKFESFDEKIPVQKEGEIHLKSNKTKSKCDPNDELKRERAETLQIESSKEKIATKKKAETVEGDIEKEESKTKQIESSDEKVNAQKESETRKTRTYVELKVDRGNEKMESHEERLKPVKTRRRGDLKVETGKEKQEKSQIELADENIASQKYSEEHLESIKTRERGDIKAEAGREKGEMSHDKLFEEKRSETTRDEVHKCETVKGKTEFSQTELATENRLVENKADFNFETTKTRKRVDVKTETAVEKIETLQIKLLDKKNSKEEEEEEAKTAAEKNNYKFSITELTKEKSLAQKKLYFESRKTRIRGVPKLEAEKEKDDISDGSLMQSKIEMQNSSISKNLTGKKTKSMKTRTRADFETYYKKEIIDISKDDSLSQTAEQHSTTAAENESKTFENENYSASDEKQPDNMCLKATNSDDNTKNKTEVLANSVIEKNYQESICSETEMSGGESSIISSNSDNTLRRTLRKRGTESPFPENDNIKIKFKGPPPKATTQLTPKITSERSGTSVFSVSLKRHLRSPASDTESPISTKKPKLEASRKTTTRFRNLHDDCLAEKELPIITTPSTDNSKEHHYLQEKLEILNESTKQGKNTEEVKDTSNVTTVVSERKVEQKPTESKTPQTSANVVQKQVFSNAVTKQCSSKEDLKSSLHSEETKYKQDKNEHSTKVPEAQIQPKTIKSKVNTTPNKSAECATVISFSDWLKAKNSNTITSNDELISSTTNESVPNISKCQSKIKAKIIEPKSIENQEKVDKVAKTTQEGTIMICHNKRIEKVLEGKQEKDQKAVTSKCIENMNVNEKPDNRLLKPSESQPQSTLKQRKGKPKNKKRNAKQRRISANKISKKTSRSKTNPTITPPRIKKSETDLLIEAMSKEMKDGGITDLLRAETHVKRQRLSMKRKDNSDIAEHFKSSASMTARETTMAVTVQQLPNACTPGLALNKEMPKVLDFSDNFELVDGKEIIKSPTKRKIPQTIEKSQKCSAKPEEPKVFATKLRKSYNVKELACQVAKDNIDFVTAGIVTSRRSMPVMSKKSPAKEISNISSRKHVGSSTLLNTIPNVESIKNLYEEDKRRSDSHNKIHHTEYLLKIFKCRKLRIILDRSIVKKYWESINKREKQILPTSSRIVSGNVTAIPAIHPDVPIIQNNSETSLRIESVIDASAILKTKSAAVLTKSQDSLVLPKVIPSSVRLQNSVNMSPIQQQQQQQQQETFILPNKANTEATLSTALVSVSDANEIIELKNEFVDENPTGLCNDAIPPDTSNLLARVQSITEAAQHALSNSVTPTDIRLLTADSSENNFVPSFGVTPTALDNKGTCMYTFLHPAKYNRNHSNVLLDYCCPNLDGPMPAIDPTRIHAQVQVPIIELPASIVLTTKVVTKADLEKESSSIPSIIRKKAEKIRKNMATHHKLATITTTANIQPILTPIVPVMTQPLLASTQRPTLPATINALTKQLPATTTITAKIRPPLPQELSNSINQGQHQQPAHNIVPSVASTFSKNTAVSVIPTGPYGQLSNLQNSSLRSNLRRFDVLLKQLVHPYETLSFVERHRIIEAVITSGKLMPQDLEQTLVLMEEYIKHTLIIKNESLNQTPPPPTPTILSTNNYITSQTPAASPMVTAQMPQLQPSPKILATNAATCTATPTPYPKHYEQTINKTFRKVQSGSKNKNIISNAGGGFSTEVLMRQQQVPIYDTDRNIIGYQMRMMTPMSSMPAYTKSTMSTHTGAIMSTSLGTSSNKITSYKANKRAVKRPAQDSPRVFYTTPPLKTSMSKVSSDSHMHPTQQAKNANTISQKSQGSIGSSSSVSSETITTTTATVKRVTRSTATGSKIIIVSKSNQSSEETILPDANNSQQQTEQTEIKNEKDVDGFLG